MTKPSRGKKPEKDAADNEHSGDVPVKGLLTEATHASDAPATNEHILATIATLNSTVDKKFTETNTILSSLQSALSEITSCLTSTKESHEIRIGEMERR